MDNKPSEEVTLKQVCKERQLDPRLSRMLLREAAKEVKKYPNLSKGRTARAPWVWGKGSKGLEEALAVLKPLEPQKTAS